ncbi:MAG: glutathione S-transferase N-terminal domain-containing protein [Caulobacter sp.]|nr:glutathione S-transferase N-terminal domain-containing protein [Caulobacter sp.]
MRLLYSSMSPFARKVRVAAHELGLTDRLELTVVSPYTDESLRATNPLSKIPVLITEEGAAIFDSPVICQYLEHRAGVTALTPSSGPARWIALTRQAMADGLGDAARTIFRERLRASETGEAPRQDLLDRQTASVIAVLDQLEADVPPLDRFQIGEIAVAVQLAYLDLRAVTEWREGRPKLADWHAKTTLRPSMVATAPQLA